MDALKRASAIFQALAAAGAGPAMPAPKFRVASSHRLGRGGKGRNKHTRMQAGPPRLYPGGRYVPHQGAQERARRRRQLEAGQLQQVRTVAVPRGLR